MLRATESLDTHSLMPIGRFARLTGLSVKALRHYDELVEDAPGEMEQFDDFATIRV